MTRAGAPAPVPDSESDRNGLATFRRCATPARPRYTLRSRLVYTLQSTSILHQGHTLKGTSESRLGSV